MTKATDFRVCPACYRVIAVDRHQNFVLHKRKDLMGDGKKGFGGNRACIGSFNQWKETDD